MKLPRAPAAGVQLRSASSWQRCAYSDCALVDDGVELMWQRWALEAPAAEPPPADMTLGLCFDRLGRALRATPAGLQSLPLAEQAAPLSLQPAPAWTPLPASPLEGCGPAVETLQPSRCGALAAAAPDLLWVAEAGAAQVWRYELWGRRYLAPQALPAPVVALCAAGGDAVLALGRAADGSGFFSLLRACNPPQALPWPPLLREPGGLALDASGTAWVLLHAGTALAELVQLGQPAQPQPGLCWAVPGARALAIGRALRDSPGGGPGGERLFVAHAPGQRWRVFALDGAEDRELVAPGYDGGAIAAAPDGRVAYISLEAGRPVLRYAAPTRLARALLGRVLSFRLDAEQPRARWGRVWLEACVPANTQLFIRCLGSDDDALPLDEAPRNPPLNQPGLSLDAHSPPLPDVLQLDALQAAPARACVLAPASGLRQGHGGWRAPRAGHQWLESWCEVEGRFLWIEIELRGDGLRSPVLRVVEVEQPGHAWLQQLPALFSREAQAADFLRRYLAAPAQLLADLGLDAEQRHQLLSPQHSPAALLDWLAGLIGWALRPAWSERARRQLLQEAGAMAPRHGTPEVLRRIVEILAGMPVLLIEDFRLRAPGVIGAEPGQASAVLGGGIRLGAALLAEASSDTAAVERSAWRFTLLLQGEPDEQLLAQLRDAVERFKPAHTAFTLCSLESGLRVGRGLHLDLAALVGPDSGLPLPVLGSTRLGRDAVIGRSTAAGAAPCP
jgi:phage tail-like protein